MLINEARYNYTEKKYPQFQSIIIIYPTIRYFGINKSIKGKIPLIGKGETMIYVYDLSSCIADIHQFYALFIFLKKAFIEEFISD